MQDLEFLAGNVKPHLADGFDGAPLNEENVRLKLEFKHELELKLKT